METSIGMLGLMGVPFLVVLGLFALAAWRERSRAVLVRRQIALTDAITGELGAIVAPVVRKRFGGRWEVQIAVPLARDLTVGRIVAIAHEVLTCADRGRGRYEIVLTPREDDATPEVAHTVPPRLRAA